MRLLPDEQLARRVAAGDRAAFTALYERHTPAMVRYCAGILLSREDAEDAAQSAMVAALEALPGRPARLQLRAWLLRVAHNEAISLLRRRRPHVSLEEAEQVSIADVSHTVDNRARLRELLTDLSSLPDRQRSALVMRELCGCSYREIAGALGGSEGAAMQTVFEARSAMAQFGHGRDERCDDVQRVISDGDRRALRARRIRAHMRSCQNCSEFEASINRRRGDLAILFPLSAKGGLTGLAALLSLHHPRPDAVAVAGAMQRMPPGMRAAALSALVAVGGGITTMNLRKTVPGRPARPLASASAVPRAGAHHRPTTVGRAPARARSGEAPARRPRSTRAEVRGHPRPSVVVTTRAKTSAALPARPPARPLATGSSAAGAGSGPVSVQVRPVAVAAGAGGANATIVSAPPNLHVTTTVARTQVQLTVSAIGTGAATDDVTSSVAGVSATISNAHGSVTF